MSPTNKYEERSHTLSPSKRLFFCFQRVFHGSADYLIVKTNIGTIIYADIYYNEYTFWPYGQVYWDLDAYVDTLVDDRIYLFIEKNGKLILLEGQEQYDKTKNTIDDLMGQCFCHCPINKNNVLAEHRIVKYQLDPCRMNTSFYMPFNRKTEFNSKMCTVQDIQGDLFKKWKSQDKCYTYSFSSNRWNINSNSWNMFDII
jgi:hypothetical protein